jgi:hypothetical protein
MVISFGSFGITHRVPILKRHEAKKNFGLLSLEDDTDRFYQNVFKSGFGGLGVSVLAADSNPAEAVGFLRAEKSSARLPSEGK